jgi:hypothetical protein
VTCAARTGLLRSFAGSQTVGQLQSVQLDLHVVPDGQHVNPLLQHTASAPYGQQPQLPSEGIHLRPNHSGVLTRHHEYIWNTVQAINGGAVYDDQEQ